jgi:hypothetical protein
MRASAFRWVNMENSMHLHIANRKIESIVFEAETCLRELVELVEPAAEPLDGWSYSPEANAERQREIAIENLYREPNSRKSLDDEKGVLP